MRITLSGGTYSGKGTLRRPLAKQLGLENLSAGDLRRSYAKKKGIDIHELNRLSEIDPIWDVKADEYQQEWSKKHPNFIIEGRISYHFIPDSIKIFLYVSPEIAAQRALKTTRESEKKRDNLFEQINANQIISKSDAKRYRKIYGIENCYDLAHFDIVIDTTPLTPRQVLKETLEQIAYFGK
jgi:cytidylate kinase